MKHYAIRHNAYIIHIWPILFGGGNIFMNFSVASPNTFFFFSSGMLTNRPCSAHIHYSCVRDASVLCVMPCVHVEMGKNFSLCIYNAKYIFVDAIINQKISNTFSSWMFVCFPFSPSIFLPPLCFSRGMFVYESF